MFKIIVCPNEKDVRADNFELTEDISFPCTFHFKNGEIVKITYKNINDTYIVEVVKSPDDDIGNFSDIRTDKAIIYLLNIPEKINHCS